MANIGMSGVDAASMELPARELVDGLEIAGVIETEAGDIERADFMGAVPDFYSVYWHLTEGGAEWLEDFATADEARDWAATLARRAGIKPEAIRDFT